MILIATLKTMRTTPVTQTAASRNLPNHKSHPTPPNWKKKLLNANSTPNTTTPNPPISTNSEPCWVRRHRHRFPQSNRRLPPIRSAYVPNLPTSKTCSLISSGYYYRRPPYAEGRFAFIQVRIKRHRWYSTTLKITILLYSHCQWAGDDS